MIGNYFRKSAAFVRKDFIIESSYKIGFIITFFGSLFPLLSFFFIDRMIGGSTPSLEKYGGAYFPFALIGIAFSRYFQLAISTFSDSMRRAQMAGCLEAILSSQTGPASVVLMSSFYSFLSAGVQLVGMFVFGALLLGFSFANTDVFATFVVVILSISVFISLGVISAAGTLIFKKGEPFGWLFGTLGGLLGGAFFPVEVMPDWLQLTSVIIPITYSLDALRLTILQGYSLDMVSDQVMILAGSAIVLLPLSLWFFKRAVEMGKKSGKLIHY